MQKWKRVIEDEIDAQHKNNTWNLVPLFESWKPVGFKWVFKIKDIDHDKVIYKARLCVQGYTQKPGTDFDEMFSTVVRFESVRTLLALAVRESLKTLQFDVNMAYLNNDLKETVYMQIPDRLKCEDENLVLNKAIYGLMQSGRYWYGKFDNFIKRLGLNISKADKCVYVGFIDTCKVFLALYVDDGLLFSKSRNTLNKIVNILNNEFRINVTNLKMFVGMEIVHKDDIIFVNQASYIRKILAKFYMMNAQPYNRRE